jgi:hypothetical protein
MLSPLSFTPRRRLVLTKFIYLVRLMRIEDLDSSFLFNYFYLARYFFGFTAQVYSMKKFFILGRTYYNGEIGFIISARHAHGCLSIWVYQMQPLLHLDITRDFLITNDRLEWLLRDPSIFSERKTNTGLFYLADPLAFQLHYRQPLASSIFLTQKLLASLKIALDYTPLSAPKI